MTVQLLPAITKLGIERIMFSVDWPYINNAEGTAWLKQAPISERDKAAIFAGNAKKLLKL